MVFSGAKLALFLGADLLVIRRDMRPDIPFPGHWDLPGGGREGEEEEPREEGKGRRGRQGEGGARGGANELSSGVRNSLGDRGPRC